MNDEEMEKIAGTKHFSICLMNPPYLGENRNDIGMPLKFLSKVCEISNRVISIQPSTIITKEFLSKKPDKNEKPVLDAINKYYTEIDILNGNKFDAALLSNTAIYNINTLQIDDKIKITNKGKSTIYNDIFKYTKYSDDNLLLEFKNIINPLYQKDALNKHVRWIDKRNIEGVKEKENLNKSDMYYLSISAVRGHVTPHGKSDDFYTFIPKDRVPEQHNRKTCFINFNNKEECQNCINYLKTDFARISLYLLKTDMNLIMFARFVPWFDFSDEHFSKSPKEIDDYLFKKYNISDDIRKHIEEILPDYYGIRK